MAKAKKPKRDSRNELLQRIARSQLRLIAAIEKLAKQQRMTRESQDTHNAAMLQWLEVMGDEPGQITEGPITWSNGTVRLSDEDLAEQLRQAEGA